MTKLKTMEKGDHIKKNIFLYVVLLVCFVIIGFLVPDDPAKFGIISVIPAAFLIIYIFKTKRILESLILAVVLCCIMGYKQDFFPVFNEILVDTMMDADIAWLIIVCGLMGSIVAVMEKNGGGFAFGNFVASKIKTEKGSLLCTALCSILLSVDDYMNALTTGTAMTPVNDRHRIPREMTSYVVDSTAAPACVFNPISTWAIFIGGLLVANGVVEPGQQVMLYLKSLPYNFYAIGALLVMFLVVIGVIPKFGPMKKAYDRVAAGGPLAPEGSDKIDIRSGNEDMEIPDNPRLINFFAPMICLVASAILSGFDMQMGVLITLGFCFIFFVAQGMPPADYFDEVIRGLKNMLLPISLMVLAFCFADAAERIYFIDYVVNTATSNITLPLLPLTVFLVFAFTEFIMGINWGMYIIAIPIVVPVTAALGGNVIVTVGAVAAAGVWGSHCCFYSDATIMTSASTGCDNFRHAITQIPYGCIAGLIAAIGYLILGFVIY